MKQLFFVLSMMSAGALHAQPTGITQAIVYTTTMITAPDESQDVSNIQMQSEGGGRMMFRSFGDGEYKSVVYLKNNMVKTVIKSEMGRSTIIRDNDAKKTTTLIEMMGNKTGFVSTDEEALQMKQRMDSLMNATRNAGDSNQRMRQLEHNDEIEIVYTEDKKKIAGYNCKKAILIRTGILGIKDSTTVWYNPEIKLNNISNTGGTMSFNNMPGAGNRNVLASLDKINGFPMSYESKLPRNRTMTVEVTRIDLKKEVEEKEFEIPKGFDVKPASEMRNMMQMRGGRAM